MTAEFKNFSLLEDSSIFALYPSYEVSKDIDQIQKSNRAVSGRLSTFNIEPSTQFKFTIPLTFVSSSDKATIDIWWKDQTTLYFSYGEGADKDIFFVKITNQSEPLPVRSTNQYARFSGYLRLSNINGSDTSSYHPFIVDHAVYGTLDGTINRL